MTYYKDTYKSFQSFSAIGKFKNKFISGIQKELSHSIVRSSFLFLQLFRNQYHNIRHLI